MTICIDCRDGKCHACIGWAYMELPDGELGDVACDCYENDHLPVDGGPVEVGS